MSAYNYLLAHTLTMHEKHYKLYVISSPSGGGKTSLIKELFLDNESKSLSLAVSDTTRKRGWRLAGDVHPNVSEVASIMSPVPGGVGPMTVAMLMANTVTSAESQHY